jgi:hypothetical protein
MTTLTIILDDDDRDDCGQDAAGNPTPWTATAFLNDQTDSEVPGFGTTALAALQNLVHNNPEVRNLLLSH